MQQLHDLRYVGVLLACFLYFGDRNGLREHVCNDKNVILYVPKTIALCFGAGLVRKWMTREVIGRIVFPFYQLDGGIVTLQFQSHFLNASRSLFLRLLHHAFQGLWVNEMSKGNALQKHFETVTTEVHGQCLSLELVIVLFCLV